MKHSFVCTSHVLVSMIVCKLMQFPSANHLIKSWGGRKDKACKSTRVHVLANLQVVVVPCQP